MIYLTGQTKGLGKAIWLHLVKKGFDITGLTRADGFDVTKPEEYHWHFRNLSSTDVVINNAYCKIGQSLLLMWLGDNYPDIHVINIGSVSADRTDATSQAQIDYSANKAHLRNTHEHLVRNGFKSTLIELGMCNTEYNKTKFGPKIDPEYLAYFIEDIVLPHKYILRKITLTA